MDNLLRLQAALDKIREAKEHAWQEQNKLITARYNKLLQGITWGTPEYKKWEQDREQAMSEARRLIFKPAEGEQALIEQYKGLQEQLGMRQENIENQKLLEDLYKRGGT